MFIATVIVSAALAILLTLSATMKLQRKEQVIESIHGTVGVPLRYIPALAALEIAAAVGLIVGLWIAPLGIAAAAGAVAYFVGAVAAHLRVNDTKGAASPLLPLAISIVALTLRILSS